jgi:hypothetical protein
MLVWEDEVKPSSTNANAAAAHAAPRDVQPSLRVATATETSAFKR